MSFNQSIIEAFRAGDGEVHEPVPFGRALGLLHIPKRDGSIAVTPLLALPDGDAWHVVASAGGSPEHPAWMYSLRRASEIDLEVAGAPGEPVRTLRVAVTEVDEAERARVWKAFKARSANFGSYEATAEGRVFPIFRLTPASPQK